MSDSKKRYDVLVPEEFSTDNGEVKTRFHRVGVAFDNRDGGKSVILPPGISLSGRFIIAPPRDDAAEA